MKIKTALTLVATTAALSACSLYGSGPGPLPVATRAPSTVEGTWVDPNGIVSTFQAGSFNTRTTDSNQLLASGTYINLSDRLVEINMTSLVRKTQSKVNCALVTSNQLNCTADSGAQFSLSRRS